MTVRTALRRLDDQVLGDRFRGGRHVSRDDARDGDTKTQERKPRRSALAVVGDVLSVVYRVARLVLLALALIVVLGIVFTKVPVNSKNTVVSHVLSIAKSAAGPLRDVFTSKDKEKALVINYALAAVVYLILATVVGKLPTGPKR